MPRGKKGEEKRQDEVVRGPGRLCSRGPLGNPQGKGEDRAGRKEKRLGR